MVHDYELGFRDSRLVGTGIISLHMKQVIDASR